MTTLPYADLLAQVEALAGATLATPERARVKIFANRRARFAHRECDFWPHLLYVGQERIVSDTGLLPIEQTGLQDIDKIIRIHAEDPFKSQAVYEYTEYYEANGGIQITGYQAKELTAGADMIVTGSLNPDVTGRYSVTSSATQGSITVSVHTNLSNSNYKLTPLVASGTGETTYISWTLGDFLSNDNWSGDAGFTANAVTPDLVIAWTANPDGSVSGLPTVTKDVVYSAFITYLAKIPSTYGDADGEQSDVPEPWFEYMAQGAYTDWLRSDGQTEKAMAEEAIAAGLLNQQLEKVSRSNGNQIITRMMSHGTKQAR